jgi:hypothetical protein
MIGFVTVYIKQGILVLKPIVPSFQHSKMFVNRKEIERRPGSKLQVFHD